MSGGVYYGEDLGNMIDMEVYELIAPFQVCHDVCGFQLCMGVRHLFEDVLMTNSSCARFPLVHGTPQDTFVAVGKSILVFNPDGPTDSKWV